MTIKTRITTLEKAMLDKVQSNNVDIFNSEVRQKILASCFGDNLDKAQEEFKLCNSEEERQVIVRKYAIRSVKEALQIRMTADNVSI
jgi:hypothetical protein